MAKEKKEQDRDDSSSTPERPSAEDLQFLEDEDLINGFIRASEEYKKLVESTNELFAEMGWTYEQAAAFIENPENFDDESWKEIQKQKDAIQAELFKGDLKELKAKQATSQQKKRNAKGKKKFLGVRKGWISID